MKRMMQLSVCCLLVLLTTLSVQAASVKVYVGEINVVGGQNRDELNAALPLLLASRLSGGELLSVTSAAEADVIVTGTYVTIGGTFILDSVISLPNKMTVTRFYVQGNGQDQLMTNIDKLAAKLRPELLKISPKVAATPVTPAVVAANAAVPATAATANVVRIPKQPVASKAVWRSPKLPATLISLAVADRASDGSRLLFVAEPNRIYSYRLHGKELRLLTEQKLPLFKNILYLDTLPLDGGATALLVTIIANERLMSQVWRVDAATGNLKLLLDNHPYFLRALALNNGHKKLYVQKLGAVSPFSEPIYEAVLSSAGITLQTQLALPKQTSLFSFGQFNDKTGTPLTVALFASGRLAVYNKDLVEVWQNSEEEYGQSELYMEKREGIVTGPQETTQIYLKQRVAVMPSGEVVVGMNDTSPFLGVKMGLYNGRNYGLEWNGSELATIWQTRTTKNYVADFTVDPVTRELLQLEIASRPSILSRGSSVITVQTVE